MKNSLYESFLQVMSAAAVWMIGSTSKMLYDAGHHGWAVAGAVLVGVWFVGELVRIYHSAWTTGRTRFGDFTQVILVIAFLVPIGLGLGKGWSPATIAAMSVTCFALLYIELVVARYSPRNRESVR